MKVAVVTAWDGGRQAGVTQQALETARRMLADGIDAAAVGKYTGLSAETIAGLQKNGG